MAQNTLYSKMASDSQYFECQLPRLAESEKAICFDTYSGHLDKNRPVWIPKSQMVIVDVIDTNDGSTDKRFFIKNWLYSKLK